MQDAKTKDQEPGVTEPNPNDRRAQGWPWGAPNQAPRASDLGHWAFSVGGP